MKGKFMAGALTGVTIATGSIIPVLNNINSTNNTNNINDNKVLLSQPVSSTAGEEAVVINGNNNLVLFNNSNGKSVNSYLSTGEMLSILGHEGNFYKVQVHETGAIGYVSTINSQIIESGVGSTFNKNITDGSIINVSTSVNLRSQPDLHAGVLKSLKDGANIEVLGTQGQWIKVNVNGTIGYIYETYVSMGNSSTTSTTTSSTSTSTPVSHPSVSTSSTTKAPDQDNVNNNVSNKTNANTNVDKTNNVINSTSSSSASSSSNSSTNKIDSNKTTTDSHTNSNKVTNPVSPINITLNDSAYIKASPNVEFHIGTSLATSQKVTSFNNQQIDNVTVLNKQNNYYEVKLSDGTVGLVNQNYIAFSGNGQKSEYLNKLNDLSIKTYNIFDTQTAQESQTNMNIYSGQCAEIWQHQLKDMYTSLMNTLPKNKADQLNQSENQFVSNVKAEMNRIATAYNGGSITPLMQNINYQQLTEQRCFEIANTYPEVFSTSNADVNTNTTKVESETNTINNDNIKSETNSTTTNVDTSSKASNENLNKKNETISVRTKSSQSHDSTTKANNSKQTNTNNTEANKTESSTTSNVKNQNSNQSNNSNIQNNAQENYTKVNAEASNHTTSVDSLNNLIYNYINDNFAPCRNYVSYSEISNIVNNGTEAQKEALIQKYGATCLVINLGTNTQSVTPEIYYNGQYYFQYSCTSLYSIINRPSNIYTGVITANGQSPSATAYNNALTNNEVYALGASQLTWASTHITC